MSGILVILLFFPNEISQSSLFIRQTGIFFQIIRLIVLGLIILTPIILPLVVRQFDPLEATVKINSYHLALASLSILVGWVLFGIAFWMIGDAIQPIALDTIPLFIFSLAVSFLIGFLIIILPASIGVRESLMVFLLGNLLTAPVAVIIAVISRLILTISELIFAGVVLFYEWLNGRREKDLPFS
jgi:uncharacterized membrane protein YbhN (UPF0104 family)